MSDVLNTVDDVKTSVKDESCAWCGEKNGKLWIAHFSEGMPGECKVETIKICTACAEAYVNVMKARGK